MHTKRIARRFNGGDTSIRTDLRAELLGFAQIAAHACFGKQHTGILLEHADHICRW